MAYLSYSEPSITTILSLTSFLLLLNISRCALDYLFHCGLIAEVLIGVIWGLPIGGTKLLDEGTQRAIQSFGFLGLTGLVFEGGLSTDLALLRRTVYMSVSIATMGLLMPIALSFILLSLPFTVGTSIKYPTPLAAFSAGASLCSTSLGTTFAMLSSANLQRTSVGVVLVGAAIMDDVVGLVMVNIIKTLGNGKTAGWGIAKPIVASFILLLVTLAVVIALLKPACRWVFRIVNQSQALVTPQNSTPSPTVQNTIKKHLNSMPHLGFIASILILIIFVSIASVIGASVLFAAFIAGGVVNSLASIQDDSGTTQSESNTNLSKMYEQYYKPAMDFILIPFFFVSLPPSNLSCYPGPHASTSLRQ
jgi:Kef-type K+ transport system membrane component KefB